MTYEQWERDVHPSIKGDPIWRVKAYRLARFIGDLAWPDVSRLVRDKRTMSTSDQLYRAAGSISANLSEGYSRGTGKDRARFYEYSLGSARETRDWYCSARPVLPEDVSEHRLELVAEIIRLLLTMIPDQRKSARF